MVDVVTMILELSQEIKFIRAQLYTFQKSRVEIFKETWVDAEQVMDALKICSRTLQNLRDNGTLPYSRINGKFYYKAADLEKLLESNYLNPKSKTDGSK